MYLSQVNWGQLLWSSLPLLYFPAGAAALGFAIGRLIHGRPYIGRRGEADGMRR